MVPFLPFEGSILTVNREVSSGSATNGLTLKAALSYARRGWPVFPCEPSGKRPLTPRGHLDATTNRQQITAWWNRWPHANIGVPSGDRSGILALDFDHPAALAALEADYGKLPATRTHATGSGGIHRLFRYPAGAEIRNSAGRLADNLDVRGEGGYIVVPPSATTRPYEALDRLPLAEAPARLLEALRAPPRARSEARHARTATLTLIGGPIPSGTRNDALTSIAGRLHDGTRALEALAAKLLEINASCCEPPLPDAEVERIAASIHRRTPCKRGTRANAETVEALDCIEGVLWHREWHGMGELSARDMYVALVKIGRVHGELIPAGVRVSISIRALALAAAVSKRTAGKAVDRLKAAGLIRSDNAGRSGQQAGALVLLTPRADVAHSPTGRRSGSSGLHLRAPLSAPRLRWSGPRFDRVGNETIRTTIRRLGKTAGAVLDALERSGGTATVAELADALHKTRTRDLRRRTIVRLEAAGVVECSGDTVSLARDWLEVLNCEREIAGEIAAHRRDTARYAREREAYANRRQVVPTAHPANFGADGLIRDLERVPDLPTPVELYPLIGKSVQTRCGPGVLWQCFSERVGVVLESDPTVVKFMPLCDLVLEAAS